METNTKVPAPEVHKRLTRDVNAILSVCIKHFDDESQTTSEVCFDVDAILSGRASKSEQSYAKRTRPARYARTETPAHARYATRTPVSRGYFIPYEYVATD